MFACLVGGVGQFQAMLICVGRIRQNSGEFGVNRAKISHIRSSLGELAETIRFRLKLVGVVKLSQMRDRNARFERGPSQIVECKTNVFTGQRLNCRVPGKCGRVRISVEAVLRGKSANAMP